LTAETTQASWSSCDRACSVGWRPRREHGRQVDRTCSVGWRPRRVIRSSPGRAMRVIALARSVDDRDSLTSRARRESHLLGRLTAETSQQ